MGQVTAEGLTKRFGDVLAVDGLSFSLEPGTITGFLGPNGAGKTTTLHMVLGLASPTSGAAFIDGVPYASLADPVRKVGAVLDSGAFHPGRTARNHLRVLAAAAGIGDDRVRELLDVVGLTGAGDRRVGGFSTGMRQRLHLAGALLGDPEILVLDEPNNGLDPEGIHWLRGMLRRFAAEGRTVLVSSHVLAELAQAVTHVMIISGGRLLAAGPLSQVVGAGGAADLEAAYLRIVHPGADFSIGAAT